MTYNTERKDFTSEFKKRDPLWRLEAVIHDGNWYDVPKWARVAKVKKELVEEWISKNGDILLESGHGSYRVAYDTIIDWYEKNGLALDAMLIPKNFPPKLWAGMTETEAFLQTPRRRVGTISFVSTDSELVEKVKGILKGVAKIAPDKKDRYKAYGLSANYIKQLLTLGLTKDELEFLDLKSRSMLMQRELIDFRDTWLAEALVFYSEYAKSVLKSSMSTISIYIPERDDQRAQRLFWVMTAIRKFDETAGVPFSGYLASVLRHWPYDLPEEYLGKELSDFQRKRSKAINEAIESGEYEGEDVPIEILAERLDLSLSDYIVLADEHATWIAERNASALTWEESGNEKGGSIVGISSEEDVEKDYTMSNLLSHAIIIAALETKDYDTAYLLIDQMESKDISSNLSAQLSDEFRTALMSAMRDISSGS